ncbi:MAG: Ig-like domain-containing protein, partial [Pleurocapsa sp.]
MEFDLFLNLLADIEEASIANLTGTVNNLVFSEVSLEIDWGDLSSTEFISIVDGGSGDTDGAANGSISFSIPHTYNEDGTFQIDVFAEDPSQDNFDEDSVSIIVNPVEPIPVNEAPTITTSATVTIPEGQTNVIDINATDDVDEEGQGLTYSITSGTDQSLFAINPNTGQLTFNSPPVFDPQGDNTFQVQVTVTDSSYSYAGKGYDYLNLTDVQDLNITITGNNQDPITVDDSANTIQDQPVSINVLNNDSDPDGDTLTIFDFSQPSNGSVEITTIGEFTYTPNQGFTGTDSFTYEADDGGETGSEPATVTINVEPPAPTLDAVNDSFNTNESTPVNGNVLNNDSEQFDIAFIAEVNGTPANVGQQITLDSGALLTVNDDGTFNYNPNGAFDNLSQGETDTDSFTYTAQIGGSEETDTATVTINIAGEANNQAPVITTSDTVTLPEGQTNVIDINSTDDTEVEGDFLIYTITGGTNQGLFSINPETGQLSFNQAPVFSPDGGNSFQVQVTVTDSFGLTDVQNLTVNITDVADPLDAVNDSFNTNESTPVNGNVLNNDAEQFDIAFIAEVNGTPANVGQQITLDSGALLTVNNDGTFNYNPNGAFDDLPEGETGADSFTYTAQIGGSEETDTATVTINIAGEANNQAPVIINPDSSPATVEVEEGQTSVIDIDTTDDIDTEGVNLTYSITSGADQELFTVDSTYGFLDFVTPPVFDTNLDADNSYEVQVTVTDSGGLTDIQDLIVNISAPPTNSEISVADATIVEGDQGNS